MVALLGMVPSAGRLRTRATSTRSNVVPAWKGMAAVPIDTVTVCPDVVVVIGRGCDWNCWTTLGAITCSSIVSLEACTMWRADYTLIEHLAERHVRWASLVITFLASHLVHLTNDLYAMRADDAEARYRHLLTYRPSLAERVTQRDMAAYLGVTQTSMSRIVTRIRAPRTTPARDDED